MPEITLEQTHALLEKLADYVMNEVPTRKEFNELKQDVNILKVDLTFVKNDLATLKTRVEVNHYELLTKMDGLAFEVNRLDTEKKAMHHTLDFHETRIGDLEEHVLGNRIRENTKGITYNKTSKE